MTMTKTAGSLCLVTDTSRLTRRTTRPALAVLLFAALAACQSGSPTASPSTTPSAATDQQILAIGREYSQCVRDHGVPNFPDMVLGGGQLSIPDNASADAAGEALRANTAARDACQPILARLPAAAQKNPPLTEQDRQNMLKFAQCMRQNGVPEWPDPRPDGIFPLLGTPLENAGGGKGDNTTRVGKAQQACKQYWDKGIPVK